MLSRGPRGRMTEIHIIKSLRLASRGGLMKSMQQMILPISLVVVVVMAYIQLSRRRARVFPPIFLSLSILSLSILSLFVRGGGQRVLVIYTINQITQVIKMHNQHIATLAKRYLVQVSLLGESRQLVRVYIFFSAYLQAD